MYEEKMQKAADDGLEKRTLFSKLQKHDEASFLWRAVVTRRSSARVREVLHGKLGERLSHLIGIVRVFHCTVSMCVFVHMFVCMCVFVCCFVVVVVVVVVVVMMMVVMVIVMQARWPTPSQTLT